jgi:hypothetical protein
MRKVNNRMLLLLCLVYLHIDAQQPAASSHYVFPVFSKGKVLQKNGEVAEAMLNYNVLSGEIIFESSPGQYLALANPEQADTVFILDRKFVPVNSKFYELLTATVYSLFLEYTCTVKDPGSDIGYGIKSASTASNAVKNLIQSGGVYSLKLPDNFEITLNSAYWIFKDGKYQKANSAKQIIAIVPDKKDKVNELIKRNNTDFSRKKDVVDLVQQL